MRHVLPGLDLAGLLQYKTTLKVHPAVMIQVLLGLNLAGHLQYKTTLKIHPTVNETSVTWA